jgi:hypothetical protein
VAECIQFENMDNLVDIRYDNVFKAVFTRNTPESQGALSKLVSVINRPGAFGNRDKRQRTGGRQYPG